MAFLDLIGDDICHKHGEQAWKQDRKKVNLQPLSLLLKRTTKLRVKGRAHPWCSTAKKRAQGSKGLNFTKLSNHLPSHLPTVEKSTVKRSVCVCLCVYISKKALWTS